MASKAGAAHIPISTISYGTVTIAGHQIPVPVADADSPGWRSSPAEILYPAQSNG